MTCSMEFIESNANIDMIMKNVKNANLNTKIEIAILKVKP